MLFGHPDEFAIDVNRSDLKGQIYFSFLARSNRIGDTSIAAIAVGCVNWARDFLRFAGDRWIPSLSETSPVEVMAATYDVHFRRSEGPVDWFALSALRTKHHMDAIGMASFQDRFAVVLVQSEDSHERLVWRDERSGRVFEERFPVGKVDAVLNEFVQGYPLGDEVWWVSSSTSL